MWNISMEKMEQTEIESIKTKEALVELYCRVCDKSVIDISVMDSVLEIIEAGNANHTMEALRLFKRYCELDAIYNLKFE